MNVTIDKEYIQRIRDCVTVTLIITGSEYEVCYSTDVTGQEPVDIDIVRDAVDALDVNELFRLLFEYRAWRNME